MPPRHNSPTRSRSSAKKTAPPNGLDKKKPFTNYDELMAAVRAYCLAEYERRWGKPWDGSLQKTKDHIVAMREGAKRGQQIWKKLCETIKDAIGFVEEHKLDITKGPDPAKLMENIPYEAIALHGWLYRIQPSIDALLELQFDPILALRSDFATYLEFQRVEEPRAPGTIRWKYQGRPLSDEDMAIVSLLADVDTSGLKKALRSEALSIEDVITREREAINTALHRHGESKKVGRARREEAQTTAKATPRKQPSRDADAKPLVKKRKLT